MPRIKPSHVQFALINKIFNGNRIGRGKVIEVINVEVTPFTRETNTGSRKTLIKELRCETTDKCRYGLQVLLQVHWLPHFQQGWQMKYTNPAQTAPVTVASRRMVQ
jgi:hypothetical protein